MNSSTHESATTRGAAPARARRPADGAPEITSAVVAGEQVLSLPPPTSFYRVSVSIMPTAGFFPSSCTDKRAFRIGSTTQKRTLTAHIPPALPRYKASGDPAGRGCSSQPGTAAQNFPSSAPNPHALYPRLAAPVPLRVRVRPVHGQRRVAARHRAAGPRLLLLLLLLPLLRPGTAPGRGPASGRPAPALRARCCRRRAGGTGTPRGGARLHGFSFGTPGLTPRRPGASERRRLRTRGPSSPRWGKAEA